MISNDWKWHCSLQSKTTTSVSVNLNKLVLITIILPVYIKSFPIVVKTLLGYVVWWTRDQTHESRGYPTRWSDYSQIESYRYDAIIVHLCSKYHILINNCCWESGSICNLYFRMIDWMLIVWTDLYCVSSTNILWIFIVHFFFYCYSAHSHNWFFIRVC